jgi:hypothetical protein
VARAAGRFLVQEGRGDEALPLVRSNNSEAAGEAAASVEQSNEERDRTVEERSRVGGSFLSDVRNRDWGGQPTWGGDDRRPPTMSALRAVTTATRNRVTHGTEQSS